MTITKKVREPQSRQVKGFKWENKRTNEMTPQPAFYSIRTIVM